jgi:hypothetical protein
MIRFLFLSQRHERQPVHADAAFNRHFVEPRWKVAAPGTENFVRNRTQ